MGLSVTRDFTPKPGDSLNNACGNLSLGTDRENYFDVSEDVRADTLRKLHAGLLRRWAETDNALARKKQSTGGSSNTSP